MNGWNHNPAIVNGNQALEGEYPPACRKLRAKQFACSRTLFSRPRNGEQKYLPPLDSPFACRYGTWRMPPRPRNTRRQSTAIFFGRLRRFHSAR